ncbi:MAG: ester cyclase [Chloroflexi bacterium]|nr:MAG: ester cyclase [Chloroflexota bacterium]
MSTEQNKAISQRIPLEAFNQGRLDVIDEIVAPDIKEHGDLPPGIPAGREGLKAIASAMRKGFPDLKYSIDLQIAEGDYVAGYARVSGTHKGEIFGMPATGKHAEWAETHIVKIIDGKVTEHWGVIDQLGMLRQLGLAPTPDAVAAGR